MKRMILAALTGALVFAGVSANALSITPSDPIFASGNETSQKLINGVLDGLIGTHDFLYKADVAMPVLESGPLDGSYDTAFLDSPTDPSGATISYVGGNFVGPTAYLLVKDGDQSPAWYLFNLTALGWNGTDTIALENFWPQQGAISHVALYGVTTPPIPEPATLLLMGTGLLGIGGLARRRRKS